MNKSNPSYNRATADAASEPAPFQWFYLLLTIICAVFLAAGFFFAARQHFLAMDLGIKNSNLRKQIDDLQGEQRRLVWSREIVMSPMEVKRIARSKGFEDVEMPAAAVIASAKKPVARDVDAPSLVMKTVSAEKTQDLQAGEKPLRAFFPADAATRRSAKSETRIEARNETRVNSVLVARNR